MRIAWIWEFMRLGDERRANTRWVSNHATRLFFFCLITPSNHRGRLQQWIAKRKNVEQNWFPQRVKMRRAMSNAMAITHFFVPNATAWTNFSQRNVPFRNIKILGESRVAEKKLHRPKYNPHRLKYNPHLKSTRRRTLFHFCRSFDVTGLMQHSTHV